MQNLGAKEIALVEEVLKTSARRLVMLAQELQVHERRCMSIASEVKAIARGLAPVEDGRGLRKLKADELRSMADALEKA